MSALYIMTECTSTMLHVVWTEKTRIQSNIYALVKIVLDIPRYVYLGFRPTREFFAITGNEQQILTNARHSWPLSSEGSLAYHTYFDIGHIPGTVTITPVTERLTVELLLTVFTFGLSRLKFEHQTFRMRGQRSNRLRHCRGPT